MSKKYSLNFGGDGLRSGLMNLQSKRKGMGQLEFKEGKENGI